MSEKEALDLIEATFGIHQDFPKKGILFRDVMPVFGDNKTLKTMIDVMCDRLKELQFDRVLGIESRGFLIGPLIADKLGLPFSPVRKKGKLPGELFTVNYELEYGHDTLEIQKNGLPKGCRCLIVDDLIATGGTMAASQKLVELSGSQVAGCAVIIELTDLKGRDKLGDVPMVALFKY